MSDPKVIPMEKRIGGILILIKDKESVQKLNELLSQHASIIIGRQGIPIRDRGLSIISLVIEGTNDEFSTLTGKLGRLRGITARSILAKD
jgi:putative iron-only hydrogenase system regulator